MKKIKGGVTAANGYKAAGVRCGIKKKKADLALILSDYPAKTAGVFTTNKFKAASVELNKKNLNFHTHFGIIINSGNANALTGKPGIDDTELILSKLANELNVSSSNLFMCSTGIIGKRLPVNKITKAIPALIRALEKDGSSQAADAIKTTDAFSKEYAVSFIAGNKDVKVGGIAKGAGMIAPNMATMLSFITTDALVDKRLLQKALKEAVSSSFNCITVDGSMSTNDTVLLFANGASLVEIKDQTENYNNFVTALKTVCLELAKMIIRDGEGATKLIEIKVDGAKTVSDAKKTALAIANSVLFKTMCYGEDANFGRVAAACGQVTADFKSEKVDIYLNGKCAVKDGAAAGIKLPKSLFKKKKIDVLINLNAGKAKHKVFTSDLGYEYVKINAEYN